MYSDNTQDPDNLNSARYCFLLRHRFPTTTISSTSAKAARKRNFTSAESGVCGRDISETSFLKVLVLSKVLRLLAFRRLSLSCTLNNSVI